MKENTTIIEIKGVKMQVDLRHAKRIEEIAKKQIEIIELEDRKKYFLNKFDCYWKPLEQAVANATAE